MSIENMLRWAVAEFDHETGNTRLIALRRTLQSAKEVAALSHPSDHWGGRFEIRIGYVTVMELDYLERYSDSLGAVPPAAEGGRPASGSGVTPCAVETPRGASEEADQR
ncbi:hypothetical protein [Nocardia asiatica]|uniref:hypothetical protein n=1 Tax=Nocardia asiatica TaxID=209252 RepID=UPI002456E47A|nr:hypothetical protein [Nocardia asiatica]